MKTLGIIPARYQSSRFPGKPLAMIGNTSMVMRVYERACQSGLDSVVVATDDQRIFDHVRASGGEVIMTSAGHPTGTSRCAEAAAAFAWKHDLIINIQGDEPFIDPSLIELLATSFVSGMDDISTLARPVVSAEEIQNPNQVKVVVNKNGHALYFSRAPIPYNRNQPAENWAVEYPYLIHTGIYAFRAEVLQLISTLPPSTVEKTESLEQLNWLFHGYRIRVIPCEYSGFSVDTPGDLAKLEVRS